MHLILLFPRHALWCWSTSVAHSRRCSHGPCRLVVTPGRRFGVHLSSGVRLGSPGPRRALGLTATGCRSISMVPLVGTILLWCEPLRDCSAGVIARQRSVFQGPEARPRRHRLRLMFHSAEQFFYLTELNWGVVLHDRAGELADSPRAALARLGDISIERGALSPVEFRPGPEWKRGWTK